MLKCWTQDSSFLILIVISYCHLPFAKVIADGRFVETLAIVEELGDIFRRILKQAMLDQVLYALQKKEKQL